MNHMFYKILSIMLKKINLETKATPFLKVQVLKYPVQLFWYTP
jgi:hypothetical protein